MERILLFDIETMANLGWVWGKWEQDVIAFKERWYMISFAYKWFGEKKIYAYSLPDFKAFKTNRKNDKELCYKLWELFNQADVVMAHNGVAFDTKKAQAKFLEHGFPPPTPFQEIDTKKIAKKYFKFDSNKLDELGQGLKVGKKLAHEGFELWLGCAEKNDPKSWKKMIQYNKRDVELLEQIYIKMRPWVNNHPNLNLINDTKDLCPNCGGHLQRRGFAITRVSKHQRFQCQECGAWSQKPINGIIR